HCDADRLGQFLDLLPHDVTHVFEFRDPSWYADEVRDLLAAAGVSFCIHDLRGADCPRWVTGPIAYLRFHGPTVAAYSGRYGADPPRRAWRSRYGRCGPTEPPRPCRR